MPAAQPTPPADTPRPGPKRFRRAQRLTHALEYQAIYADRLMRTRGPLVVYAKLRATPTTRLGLSVGRRVGPAVERNRAKRLLREAFRLQQHELPTHLDLIINLRPHKPLTLAAYSRHLLDAAHSLARALRRNTDPPPPEQA